MQSSLMSNVGRSVGLLTVLAACASAAWAGPELAIPDRAGAPAAVAATAPAAAAATPADTGDAFGFGPAADLGKLAHSRGGTDTVTTNNNANLGGVVTGNSATNVQTGANFIDSGSFANMSGIPVVIQNSGANVLIQSATIVNLQFQ